MRVFSSCTEMLNETAREVFSRGVWTFDKTRQAVTTSERAKEIIGYCYRLTSFYDVDQMFPLARQIFKKDFLRKEIGDRWFEEMFSPVNPQTFWTLHPELHEYYKKYCEMRYINPSLGVVTAYEAYTYGERVCHSYRLVIDKLAQNIERKAAVIPVFWEIDVERVGEMRVPCSMFYQFLARPTFEGYKLHLVYVQRSCDLAWFFTFDVYRAIRLIQKAVEDLQERDIDIEEGHLIHFISSLHAFESDIDPQYRW